MALPRRAKVLSAAFTVSAVVHLVRPRTYELLVPPELGNARRWVLGTGVAELATGLLTAFVPAHLHTFRVVPATPAAARGRGAAAAAADPDDPHGDRGGARLLSRQDGQP